MHYLATYSVKLLRLSIIDSLLTLLDVLLALLKAGYQNTSSIIELIF